MLLAPADWLTSTNVAMVACSMRSSAPSGAAKHSTRAHDKLYVRQHFEVTLACAKCVLRAKLQCTVLSTVHDRAAGIQ